MKHIATLAFFFSFSTSFSQWTRVQQLPSTDIFSLYRKNNILYAGGKNIIYFSRDNGQTWDSTSIIPRFFEVDNIIVYKDELYATCFSVGVYKSRDGGGTWQNINAGIVPFVSDFCEFNRDLYAATLGSSVFKLDTVNRNNWLSFSNGLSDFSANITSIAGNNNALTAGTLANGIYGHLAANSTTWEERFLLGQLRPTEGVYDIITGHDSLFLAGHTGLFYISTDNGLNWNNFGNRVRSSFTSLVNAKQAVLFSRDSISGTNNTSFYYIKKDSLLESFVPFSFVPDHFTYKLEIFGNKLWDASTRGLFYMPLSDLPGISSADDSVAAILLPVRYISFNVQLKADRTVLVQWKTADEINIDHFEIERSADAITWSGLASAGPQLSHEYSYTDASPLQGANYYRIKALDSDGKLFYTTVKQVMIANEVKFLVWPNPVHDMVFINIVSGDESQVIIKVFDSKGALVKNQRAIVLRGSNQLRVDMQSLANGVYSLFVDWNNGQMTKTAQVLKQ